MSLRIHVGNLSYIIQDMDLEWMFGQYGTVSSAEVIMDRETGQSKGFGFVEMESAEAARKAIAELNGQEFEDHAITVGEAKPRPERSGRSGSRSGGYSGNGSGRFGGPGRSDGGRGSRGGQGLAASQSSSNR